jgi:hypothetical protein
MYNSYFSMQFADSDARIRFYTKFYAGNMLVQDMPPHFPTQTAVRKEEDTS